MNDLSKNKSKRVSPSKKGVVRATFSLPESALDEIEAIRMRLAQDGLILNKSEVVRIGLAALENISDGHVRTAVKSIERLKAGRPNLTGS